MADDKKKSGVDDLGGIFGVSSGKKKKKKPAEEPAAEAAEAKAAEEPQDLEEDSVPFPEEEPGSASADANSEPAETADAEEPEEEAEELAVSAKEAEPEKPKAKAKAKKGKSGIEGVLIPSDDDEEMNSAEYLGSTDLDDYEAPKNKTVPMLVGVIGLLVVVIIAGGVWATGSGGDLVALFKGELREKRIDDARRAEEEFKKEQLAKLDLFGNLIINGNPQYALIKLNGQRQYGQTSSGAWRELRIGTTPGIQDLKIKDPQNLEFELPGFETKQIQVTQGMWQENPGAPFSYGVSATLDPVSMQAKLEFDARLSQDEENEFFGKVSINTMPSGAKVTFDNKPLLDEKGQPLTTPVTFDKVYVKNDAGKLEEAQIKVDTALDVGHKIELEIEAPNSCPEGGTPPQCGQADGCCPDACNVATDVDCKWPKYVTSLQRQMWTCTWKDGAPPAEVEKGKTIQHYCDYSFQLDHDFNGLKGYIVAREEERQRILDQYRGKEGPDAGAAAEAAETAQAAP